MTTEVYLFLPPPNASGVYREAYSFGPDGADFHTDLGIEIDPAFQANSPALAVVPGFLYLIPNPSLPLTASLFLIPHFTAIVDLGFVVGKSVVIFVYRNLDLASIRARITPKVEKTVQDHPELFTQSKPLEERVDES